MNRLLLIVDPQIDFISGSLPVPDAAAKMDSLAEYIKNNNEKYALKLVTTDWHPYDHCSFKENGGEWPKHCVHDSVGSAIYQALLDALHSTKGTVEILRKGTNKDTEEYSIFKNTESSSRIDELIKKYDIKQIDICGIAGNVCVLNTLKDGVVLYGKDMFNVLEEYSPSLDGGKALKHAVAQLN